MNIKDINWRKQLTLPNVLTLLRLAAIPVMAWYLYRIDTRPMRGFILFVLIWTTDVLDGWIARRFNQESKVGRLLDPLADKIFQLTTGYVLWDIGRLPLWVPLILFIKEGLLILGSLFLFKKRDTVVHSQWFGKLTTVLLVTCFAITMILPEERLNIIPWLYVIPVGMSIFSLLGYARTYLRKEQEEDLD